MDLVKEKKPKAKNFSTLTFEMLEGSRAMTVRFLKAFVQARRPKHESLQSGKKREDLRKAVEELRNVKKLTAEELAPSAYAVDDDTEDDNLIAQSETVIFNGSETNETNILNAYEILKLKSKKISLKRFRTCCNDLQFCLDAHISRLVVSEDNVDNNVWEWLRVTCFHLSRYVQENNSLLTPEHRYTSLHSWDTS